MKLQFRLLLVASLMMMTCLTSMAQNPLPTPAPCTVTIPNPPTVIVSRAAACSNNVSAGVRNHITFEDIFTITGTQVDTFMSNNACGCPLGGTVFPDIGMTIVMSTRLDTLNIGMPLAYRTEYEQKLFSYEQGLFSCTFKLLKTEKDYGCLQQATALQNCEFGEYFDQGVDPNPCVNTPIIIDMAGDRIRLTTVRNGAHFDLNNDGRAFKASWTKRNSDDAFLVMLDRGDGLVANGSDLFGTSSPKPLGFVPGSEWNGFEALKVWDSNGDEKISAADQAWGLLGLWYDRNKNGKSDAGELVSMPNSGIEHISLRYKETPRVDSDGNQFKWKSKVKLTNGDTVKAFDVYLVSDGEDGFTVTNH